MKSTSALIATSIALIVAHACAQPFSGPSHYPVGSIADSIAVADLNGDGWPDAAVTLGENSGELAVLAGDGAGGFLPPVTYPTGPNGKHPNGVAIRDLDCDGRPEIVVANGLSGTVMVWKNLTTPPNAIGPTSFCLAQTISVTGDPFGVAIGDVDHDCWPDIVVANKGTQGIDVLLNTTGSGGACASGTLSFVHHFVSSSVPFPLEPILADLNGDSYLDVACPCAVLTGEVVIFSNLGAGPGCAPFGSPSVISVMPGTYPRSGTAGDFNCDGHADLAVVSNNASGQVAILISQDNGTGVWQFGSPTLIPLSYSFHIRSADIDGDGDVDLAVARTHPDHGNPSLLTVMLNNGAGTFAEQPGLGTVTGTQGVAPVQLAFADLNGDTATDIILCCKNHHNLVYPGDVTVFLNDRPVQLDVSFRPKRLRLCSHGNWVTCYVTPPGDIPVSVLDPVGPELVEVDGVDVSPVVALWTAPQDQDGDGAFETLMVKFDRASIAALLSRGRHKLTVRGQFTNGRVYTGTDRIRAR